MIFWLILIFVILILVSILLVFYNQIHAFFEKKLFTHSVNKKVYQIARDNDYYLLNKVALVVEGKTIHFNYIIFGNKYIYCIGNYYYQIAISGKYKDPSWYQYKRNNHHIIIKNPMILQRERVNYFSSKIASSSDLFVALFVVNDSCLIDEIEGADKYNQILNISKLSKLIKKYESDDKVEPIHPDMLHDLVQQISKFCE